MGWRHGKSGCDSGTSHVRRVGVSRISANGSYTTALQSLLKFMGIEKISALVAMEIGGGNGMRNVSWCKVLAEISS